MIRLDKSLVEGSDLFSVFCKYIPLVHPARSHMHTRPPQRQLALPYAGPQPINTNKQ